MKLQRLFIAIASGVLFATGSVTAVLAVQSPPGCNSNRLNLSVSRDKVTVQQGDTITYTVTLSNVDSGPDIACDISDATVTLTLPASDGTPTGMQDVLANNVDYPAGTALAVVGTVQYVVNVNTGITDIVAEARVQGTLNDAPVDHAADVTKTIGTTVVWPTTPSTGGSGGTSSSSSPLLPNAGVVAFGL